MKSPKENTVSQMLTVHVSMRRMILIFSFVLFCIFQISHRNFVAFTVEAPLPPPKERDKRKKRKKNNGGPNVWEGEF